MSSRTRPYAFCLAAVLLLTWSTAVVAAQRQKRPSKAAPKPPPVCTEAQARAYMAEAVPLVEEAAGRKFQRIPRVKLATREELVPVITTELMPQMRVLMAQNDPDARRTARSVARMYSRFLFGKYGSNSQTLYLVPENVRPGMKSSNVDPRHTEAFIKLTIAHELTHALQDQYVGLARIIRRARTMEQVTAISSTIEGHATWVQDRVAEALKIEDSEKEFVRAIGAEPGAADPAVRLTGSAQTKLMSDLYLRGRDFIAWNYKQGGSEQVWKVISAPPARTSMILHPETYAPTEVETVDYKQVLSGTEKLFGNRKWRVKNAEIGEMQLRALYADLDQPLRDAVLANFDRAQVLVAVDGSSVASICLMSFKDGSILPSLIPGFEKMYTQNIKKLQGSPTVKVTDVSIGRFTAMQSDANSKVTFIVKSGSAKLPNETVHVVRGKIMLEIYTQSVPLPDARIAEIAESILAKLPQPAAPAPDQKPETP